MIPKRMLEDRGQGENGLTGINRWELSELIRVSEAFWLRTVA